MISGSTPALIPGTHDAGQSKNHLKRSVPRDFSLEAGDVDNPMVFTQEIEQFRSLYAGESLRYLETKHPVGVVASS